MCLVFLWLFEKPMHQSRQERNNAARDNARAYDAVRAVAARAVGLSYGPSECRPADADDHIQVNLPCGDSYATTIPVQYVLTRNRGILESVSR